MRYLISALNVLLIVISANSQNITIDENDLTIPNVYTVSTVNSITFNPDETEEGYTWDFSFLEYDTQINDTFFAVSSAPYVYQFSYNNPLDQEHKATVVKKTGNISNAVQVIEITDNYDYYKNSTSKYVKVGSGSTINGVPTVMKYDNVENITTQFPLQIYETNSSVSTSGTTIPTIGYYGQTVNRTNEVDGYGTLITPYGTFETVRIKSVINIRDTLYYDDYSFGTAFNRPETIEYNWFADNQFIPILTVKTSGGSSYSATYKDSLATTNLATLNKTSKTSVFPNPTTGQIIIECENLNKVEVYSVSGKLVKTSVYNKINISDEEKGVYFIKVITKTDINTIKLILN